ncbi:hypothetical protein P7C71_g1704, partial [Lecanoromycetidae sp. Uapishka_2]
MEKYSQYRDRGTYISFLWNLLSKPTHCIRVRIAESIYNTSQLPATRSATTSDLMHDDRASSSDTLLGSEEPEGLSAAEKRVLDKVAEALARLGRVKRVGLGVRDKESFIRVWDKKRH